MLTTRDFPDPGMPVRARTALSTVAFSLCGFVRGDSFLQLKSIYEMY